ncbi:di-heme oxidoredictase family protein [Psychrobacter sp. I-STPA6b]|uniref:di-heme oxidoredictase family protein n=1 Tax=Psychrobacter sp. I-STPA6b TaxID=2585718 RepID=UPI001D0C2DA6|nr:di-heme oxidoredictase family protein [Psychrobacter sp. I-STPA6b]
MNMMPAFNQKPLQHCLFLLLSLCVTACGGSSGGGQSNNQPDNHTEVTPPVDPNPNPTPSQPRQWTPAGGQATIAYNEHRPFLTLIPHLDINQLSGVSQGRELFITNWTPAGEGRALFDGLGPLFNAVSCTSCHSDSGRVSPYLADGTTTDGVLFRIGNKQGDVHPIWGAQLQPKVIDNTVGLLAEGKVHAHTKSASATALKNEGLSYYQFELTPYDSNQHLGNYHLGARIAPQLLGMGLLDLVPEDVILANADPDDTDNNGISGRVHWVFEGGQKRIGRFGWKAINSSLRTQNATAMSQDMGLTTPVHIDSSCTPDQPLCTLLPLGGSPEVSDASLSAVVSFMTALSVPERRIHDQVRFDKGADLFEQVGCAQCHIPTLTTGESQQFYELSNQTIYAYTDLLLHDMGEGLDDGVKEINAESYEWRTPPLWGIGIVAKDKNARFLHDGRAKTLKEAILWHGGEAEKTREQFQQLTEQEQQTLLQFLQGI